LPIENATEERSYDRFLMFSHVKKQLFFKNTQNQRAKDNFFFNETKMAKKGEL